MGVFSLLDINFQYSGDFQKNQIWNDCIYDKKSAALFFGICTDKKNERDSFYFLRDINWKIEGHRGFDEIVNFQSWIVSFKFLVCFIFENDMEWLVQRQYKKCLTCHLWT